MKSLTFIAMFLVAPSFEFPAANLLDGLQQVSIEDIISFVSEPAFGFILLRFESDLILVLARFYFQILFGLCKVKQIR